jgi:transcriptional regulator with XRE-family HTH domain
MRKRLRIPPCHFSVDGLRQVSAKILFFKPMTELPNRLREFRNARHLSLEKVALEADCSAMLLSQLERGDVQLTVRWMERLAPILGVAPADLLLARHNRDALDPEEMDLVDRLRRATPEQREQLLSVATIIVPDPPRLKRTASV